MDVTAHGCGAAIVRIFQVFSVSISDQVAREELVVWLLVVDHRNITAPPVLANE